MTDAVSKNLHIEDRIAEAMQSEYKPLNLTCKSHAVEAWDRSNIKVFSRFKNKLGFRDALISMNPFIGSFLQSDTSFVLVGIKSISSF